MPRDTVELEVETPTKKAKKIKHDNLRALIPIKAFRDALTHMNAVVERRNTIPILGCIRIKASGGDVSLIGTDLDNELTIKVPAEQVCKGDTCVYISVLNRIVSQAFKEDSGAKATVLFDYASQSLSVSVCGVEYTLPTMDPAHLPSIKSFEVEHSFDIESDAAKKLICTPRNSISTEKTRYYLNGICVHPDGDTLRAVATDGHRLTLVKLPLPDGAAEMPKIIIPSKAVVILANLSRDNWRIGVTQKNLFVSGSGWALRSKLIEGTYPDYTRAIPLKNDKFISADAAKLASAVKRASLISSEKARPVKLSATDGKLSIECGEPSGGKSSTSLLVEYKSDPLEIGFNARYLNKVLSLCAGNVVMKMADKGDPAIFQPEDESVLFVIMPMLV